MICATDHSTRHGRFKPPSFESLWDSSDLYSSGVTSLPADALSGLTALTSLVLDENTSLGSLPANQFSGLTKLKTLQLSHIGMTELPAGLFSGLTELTGLYLTYNGLTSLPAGVFSGLSKLESLYLSYNQLTSTSLPDGVFSGLTALTTLHLNDNPTAPMPLTVTLEKVGTDGVRAKLLAGAPFAVDIPVTVVDGTLAGSATALSVAAGSVDGTPLTVTRTTGTTAAVTVNVDLSTQPMLPSGHQGYEFVKATRGLPATILPDPITPPTVESVAVKSAPQSENGYGRGETIVFTLTFSDKVRVTGQPQPKLAFDLGGSTREARYTGITDTDVDSDPRPRPRPEGVKVHFAYTVQPGDRDSNGIQVGELASAIDLGGARIRSAADLVDADGHKVDGVDADLAHAALGRLRDHKVDGGTAQLAGRVRDHDHRYPWQSAGEQPADDSREHPGALRAQAQHPADAHGAGDGDRVRRRPGSAGVADGQCRKGDHAGRVGDPVLPGTQGGDRRRRGNR